MNRVTFIYPMGNFLSLHIEPLDWHFAGDTDYGLASETCMKFAQTAAENEWLNGRLRVHLNFWRSKQV